MDTQEPMTLLPAALRIAAARNMELPKGLVYGLRVCRADFTSSHSYRWPFPGTWATARNPNAHNTGACPHADGDGLCIGRTWSGMASGGMPADIVLLIGHDPKDVLGREAEKLRVSRALVVDVFTVASLLAERRGDEPLVLDGANLYGANLYGANLDGANLSRANLDGANLYGAIHKDKAVGLPTP